MTGPRKISWGDVEAENLSEKLSRKFVSSERMTIARLELKRGLDVPEHRHENEQISLVLEGELLIEMQGEQISVRSGELIIIPSDVPHKVTVMEDTTSLDIFSPPRADWISGDDQYLRG